MVFILLLILTTQIYAHSAKFNSTITIKSDKEQYYIYEPIFIEFELINNDLIGPSIHPSLSLMENFLVVNEKDERFSCNISFEFAENSIQPLKEKSLKKNIMLNYHYGLEFPVSLGNHYLPIGRYTISFKWKESLYDPINSNIITIDIIEPPVKYKQELELFEKAVNLGELAHNITKQNEFITLMDELISKYPQGIYREYSLYMKTTACLFYSKTLIAKNAGELFINDYPQSLYPHLAVQAIADYYIENKMYNEGIEYMNTLKNRNTNPIFIDACKRQIKLINIREKSARSGDVPQEAQ